MTIERDDDIRAYGYNAQFDTTRIPYIPNIAYHSKEGRPKHIPLTKDMVIPPRETLDCGAVTPKTYIHEVVFEGKLNSPRKRSREFDGYRPYDRKSDDPSVHRPVKLEGFRYIRSFMGAGGTFHIRWLRRRCPGRPPGSVHNLSLICRPQFRQDLWRSAQWVREVVGMVEAAYGKEGYQMGLRHVEIPTDLIGDFDREGLEQCYWRSWGREMRKHEGTSYIGSVEKRNHRTNAIYEKQGGFHPEARLDGRVLRRHNIVRLSDAALTLLLVEILKNERIIYLDAEKLAHPTAKTRERGLDYWRRFLSNGVMSATKMMKITGISNPSNKTSPHPLNAVFGASLATTAAAGIERLGGVDGAAGVTAREFLAQRDRYKFLLSVAAKLKLALQPEHEQVTAMRKVADGRP